MVPVKWESEGAASQQKVPPMCRRPVFLRPLGATVTAFPHPIQSDTASGGGAPFQMRLRDPDTHPPAQASRHALALCSTRPLLPSLRDRSTEGRGRDRSTEGRGQSDLEVAAADWTGDCLSDRAPSSRLCLVRPFLCLANEHAKTTPPHDAPSCS